MVKVKWAKLFVVGVVFWASGQVWGEVYPLYYFQGKYYASTSDGHWEIGKPVGESIDVYQSNTVDGKVVLHNGSLYSTQRGAVSQPVIVAIGNPAYAQDVPDLAALNYVYVELNGDGSVSNYFIRDIQGNYVAFSSRCSQMLPLIARP